MNRNGAISHIHIDLLKEIGNIGAGNAATALSKLIGKRIEMSVPDVKMVSLHELPEILGGSEKVVSSIFFRVEGNAPLRIFFIQHIDQALKLVNDLTDEVSTNPLELSELGRSVLQEIGNILTGSYLSALSDFTKIEMIPSVPALAIDMAGAIIIEGLVEDIYVDEDALLVDTAFFESSQGNKPSESIEGYFFLIPDYHSFETIFNALGVPYND